MNKKVGGVEAPLHTHDCDRCVFLGTYERHDLYYCGSQRIGSTTVIARWGSDGSEYSSGIEIAVALETRGRVNAQDLGSTTRALRVAYLIARDVGFDVTPL